MLKASNLGAAAELINTDTHTHIYIYIHTHIRIYTCLTRKFKLIYLCGSSSIKTLVDEEVFSRLLHKPTILSATI